MLGTFSLSNRVRSRAAGFALLVFFSIFFAVRTQEAHAQVNVEVLRKQLTEQGVHGKIAGSITTYSGNTTGTELGGGGLVGFREGPELVYFTTNANYANLGGNVQVANAFAHFRYNHSLNDWVAAEVFTQGESDRFRRLRL